MGGRVWKDGQSETRAKKGCTEGGDRKRESQSLKERDTVCCVIVKERDRACCVIVEERHTVCCVGTDVECFNG